MIILNFNFILIFVLKFSAAHIFEFNTILHNLITSIENIIDYYDKNLVNFNVDGIFGLQILRGEISYAMMSMDMDQIKLMKQTASIDSIIGGNLSFLSRLSHLKERVNKLTIKAGIHLNHNYPDYYNKMKYFVINEWMPKIRYRTVREVSEKNITVNDQKFDESTSDTCLSEIIKYITNDVSDVDNCKISKVCMNVLLLQRGFTAYLITHQVLYSTLIQKSNCLYHINNLIRGNNTSVDELQNEFCSYIFNENKNMYPKTSRASYRSFIPIPSDKQDLFLEQVFLCGTIGFMEFVNLKFLPTIISWISESGCFKTLHMVKDNQTLPRRRHILEEVVMSDYCLSHKTSLGLAVLSTYLRLFFNSNIPSYFKKDFNIITLLKEERLLFLKRYLPKVKSDPMSLYDAYTYAKKDLNWIPYFESNTLVYNKTISYSEIVNYDFYFYFYIIMIVIILFFCLRKFKKCIRYLIKI